MRTLPSILALLLAAACTGSGDAPDSGGGTDGTADGGASSDGGSSDPPQAIDPDGDRVLVYTGHGGMEPQGTGKASFLLAEARFEALGYNLHTRDQLPDDLAIYRLILLVAPGSSAAQAFTSDEVARLEAARAVGSRLAVLGDPSMCASAEVGQLLADLGTELAFTGDGADANQIILATDLDDSAQPLAGVGALRMRDPCYAIGPGGGILARDDLDHGLIAAQRPADGGDVLVVGDLELLDDENIEDEDNAVFADNLALVVP